MRYDAEPFQYALLSAAMLLLTPIVFAFEPIGLESVIVFNTACARCHEGECSGRMSFHLPKGAADRHIYRHGGELPDETNRQLLELLRYMKEECSYYPLPPSPWKDRVLDSNALVGFRSLSGQAYFVPLGILEQGAYQLLLEASGDETCFRVEVITGEFDFVDTQSAKQSGGNKKLLFDVSDRSGYFLRVTANKSIDLRRVELVVDNIGPRRMR